MLWYKANVMAGLNFHQLEVFHAVATAGSFSRAAERLGISQPAVSIQVRELENRVGASLFHRMRKGLERTDTGHTVFAYTQRLFALVDEMNAAVGDIGELRAGRLSIGASTTPGEYILPWVIGRFQRLHPAIEVSLSISNTQETIKRIADRELDLGMVGADISMPGLASFEYVTDRVVIIAHPGHPLVGVGGKVPLKTLDGERFILREPGSATRRAAEDCLAKNEVSVVPVMELGSNEAVKRAVAAGLGLGLVSIFGAEPDVTAGTITVLDVDGWECKRPLVVFHREDSHLPPAQKAFLEFLREERPLPGVSKAG